jgi:hypothetical protein
MESITQQINGKENRILKIIDTVLKQVFGEEATYLIYRHLENKYGLKRNEMAEKIEVFAVGLEEFLRSGAYVIERKILEDIYSNYGSLHRLESERVQEETDFVSQVKSLMGKA